VIFNSAFLQNWDVRLSVYFCKKNCSMAKDWKDRLGVVYSTNPEFQFETGNEKEKELVAPGQQTLKVSFDRKQRKGKSGTGFYGKR
jgi:hypothetical protein